MQSKRDNIYEFLVCMKGGRVSRVTVIYPTASTHSKEGEPGLEVLDRSQDELLLASTAPGQQSRPKIICQSLISKCLSVSSQRRYSTMNIHSQTNCNMFRQIGEHS